MGKNELMLFIDGSVNTRSKVGYGAYLTMSDCEEPLSLLKPQVKVKRFEHTSSTKLEIQTLLWALNDIRALGKKVIVYTDSQNLVGLPERRQRLEQNAYTSKKNKTLKNYALYQEFFRRTDEMQCEFVKVRGHQASKTKNTLDKIFTLVDKASRKALRENNP